MISPTRVDRVTHERHYHLPLDAREINDVVRQVNAEHIDGDGWDDRYWVKSDGESLIFYWED